MLRKTSKNMLVLVMLLMIAVVVSGCGGQAATAAVLPVYPGAVVLKPGEDPIADTLAKNMEQDASIRQGMGVGGKMEQFSYKLPADASWEAVKAFYDKELTASGWQSGLGGLAGDIASQALEAANQGGGDMMKMALYSKGGQTLTILRVIEAPTSTQPYLIASLNSN